MENARKLVEMRTPNRNPVYISQGYFSVMGGFNATSPTDSTTYYFGSLWGAAMGTTVDINRVYIPYKGTIKAVRVYILCNTIAGSSEDVAVSLRLNNTTEYAIQTKGLDSGKKNLYSNLNLNIAVAAGDYIEIKIVTPAWATNPTGVYGAFQALVFYEQ